MYTPMITGFRPIAVREPAGDERHRHREHDQRPVHRPVRRLRQQQHLAQVEQREEVHDAQAATAATEDRGEIDPAVVGVGEDLAERGPDAAVGDRRLAVRARSRGRTAGSPARSRPPGSRRSRRPPRQSRSAISGAPTIATITVPTLPPEMWALIAKPRRSSGNCSARRPLPTGCWGDPPTRDTTLRTANDANPGARACAAKPPPNRIPPAPRIFRREIIRVSFA